MLKLADWVWAQFYPGATLKPAERGRLASKLLRHHKQDGEELVTTLSLADFLKWYKTVRSAMFERQPPEEEPESAVAPEPATADKNSLEDLTPFKSPNPAIFNKSPQVLTPIDRLLPEAMRSTPPPSPSEGVTAKILVTKVPPKSPGPVHDRFKPVPAEQEEGPKAESNSFSVLSSNDSSIVGPARSSPPSRPMQKAQADGASLETPFRGERPSFDGNSTYDSIPSASPAAWSHSNADNGEPAAVQLDKERKHVKRLLKIQERLQADFDDILKQNKELVQEREQGRMIQEREVHKQQSKVLNQPSKQQAEQPSMQVGIDEMMLHHSATLDAKNTQIIKATNECQDAHRKIEELERLLREGPAPTSSMANHDAELHKQIDALNSDVAAKDKRIASLQASLVSLRKIVQKFEGAKTSDELEKMQKETTVLQQKNLEMAAQLESADKRYALAVRATETATGLLEKATAKAENTNNGVNDHIVLEKKLRETQRLLLEAYAETDIWRSQQAEMAEIQSKKEQALEAKLRQVVAFAYTEREELTKRCANQEQHIDKLHAQMSLLLASNSGSVITASTYPVAAPTYAESTPPPKLSEKASVLTPPPSGKGINSWMHSVA